MHYPPISELMLIVKKGPGLRYPVGSTNSYVQFRILEQFLVYLCMFSPVEPMFSYPEQYFE